MVGVSVLEQENARGAAALTLEFLPQRKISSRGLWHYANPRQSKAMPLSPMSQSVTSRLIKLVDMTHIDAIFRAKSVVT